MTEVLLPGARASEYARVTDSLEGGRALSGFPQPPFYIVLRHTNLYHNSRFATEHEGSAADEMDVDDQARGAVPPE